MVQGGIMLYGVDISKMPLLCFCFCSCIELRKQCEEEGKVMPMSTHWLTGRNNKDNWFPTFFDRFISHVVGTATFRNKVVAQFV